MGLLLAVAGLACARAQTLPVEITTTAVATSTAVEAATSPPVDPATPTPAATVTPGFVATLTSGEYVVDVGGETRSFLVHVPASAGVAGGVDLSQPAAVVFVFHGGGGNAEYTQNRYGLDATADEFGFVVVYPNGSGRLSDEGLLTWNGGGCCGYAQRENIDEAAFVRAMLADLGGRMAVDARRIYATGMSNGGILSHRLACDLADTFAAIAPVAGTLNYPDCAPSEPVAVFHIHGADDRHVLYDGGQGPDAVVAVDFASVAETIDFWVQHNGCTDGAPQTTEAESGLYTLDLYPTCASGTAVQLMTVPAGGHNWPGAPARNPDVDVMEAISEGNTLIWQFFEAHPKP